LRESDKSARRSEKGLSSLIIVNSSRVKGGQDVSEGYLQSYIEGLEGG
jgi:hypothetical protein